MDSFVLLGFIILCYNKLLNFKGKLTKKNVTWKTSKKTKVRKFVLVIFQKIASPERLDN